MVFKRMFVIPAHFPSRESIFNRQVITAQMITQYINLVALRRIAIPVPRKQHLEEIFQFMRRAIYMSVRIITVSSELCHHLNARRYAEWNLFIFQLYKQRFRMIQGILRILVFSLYIIRLEGIVRKTAISQMPLHMQPVAAPRYRNKIRNGDTHLRHRTGVGR